MDLYIILKVLLTIFLCIGLGCSLYSVYVMDKMNKDIDKEIDKTIAKINDNLKRNKEEIKTLKEEIKTFEALEEKEQVSDGEN